jgi:nickel superoxide dismutase
MMRTSLPLLACLLTPLAAVEAPAPPAAKPVTSEALGLPVHCQVPCGIYGDKMRIDMLMEDAATIEKGMQQLVEMDGQESPSMNQRVRWIMNKDTHAQAVQDQVASYWLAQRIKSPKEAGERPRYLKQLEVMHGITVAAMKCKQTTEVANVVELRRLALEFSDTYFKAEDLEHIRAHHGEQGEKEHR